MRRRILWFVGLTAVHAVLTGTIVVVTMGLGMAAFDGKRAAGAVDAIGGIIAKILMAPLMPLYPMLVPYAWRQLPGVGNTVFILNSTLWAAALIWLIGRGVRSRHHTKGRVT
jgi:hypothetical protein